MRKLLAILGVLALMIPVGVAANADKNVFVGEDEQISKTYIKAGESVDLRGHFLKDVIVAGKSVTISGIIDGDLFVVGESVRITGTVNGSVRGLARNIDVIGEVGRGVSVAGNTIFTADDSKIGEDIFIAGETLNINGLVNGDAYLAGASVNMGASLKGDMIAKLGHGH